MLGGLVQALVAPAVQTAAVHNMRLASEARTTTPGLTAGDLQSLKQRAPNNNKTDKPKAYLNYAFFDKQLNFVPDGSGVKQVDGDPGQLETLSSDKVVAKKDGYIYVYTSNESSQDVLFDNFGVMDITGPVLEETHYYPYGLTMAGISTVAPLKLANNYKYNSKELNHDEFSDGSGLEWYSYGDREYDPQIGVFHALDPYAVIAAGISPFSYAADNPVLFMDINGDSVVPSGEVQNDWHNFDTQNNTVGLKDLVVTGSRSYSGNYDPLYTGIYNSLHVNWIRSFGKGVRHAGIWFNQNLNPLYLAFNGINSQFTGMDYLTGDPVSHVDGFVQVASAIPIGKIAHLGEITLGSLERLVAEDAAKGGQTVIGEGMKRVSTEAAKREGSVILNNMPNFTGTADQVTSQMMTFNRQWLLQQMRSGRPIIDIGLDPARGVPSIFYQMEQNMIKNYLKLHPNAFQVIKP